MEFREGMLRPLKVECDAIKEEECDEAGSRERSWKPGRVMWTEGENDLTVISWMDFPGNLVRPTISEGSVCSTSQ